MGASVSKSCVLLALAAVLAMLSWGCDGQQSPGSLQADRSQPASAESVSQATTGDFESRTSRSLPAFHPSPPEEAERLDSGIWVKKVQEGHGSDSPTPSTVVVYHVRAWDPQGRLMMNSRRGPSPSSHPLGRSWPGLRLSLEHMVVGEESRFWIPRSLIDYSEPRDPTDYYLFDLQLLDIQPLNRQVLLTPEQLDVVRKFNVLYAKTHTRARNIGWLGVEIQQNPCDAWMWQELIWELKPDFIVETGTYTGGSALYFASLFELMGLPGKVITVDLNPMVDDVGSRPIFRERVQVIRGDSVSPEVVEQVAKKVEGAKVVLVTLDSLHTKDHVLKELERYGPLVTPGSYIVVQDTLIEDFAAPRSEPGPGAAVEEFLKTHPEFQVDRDRERLLLTYYSGGYLRRVR